MKKNNNSSTVLIIIIAMFMITGSIKAQGPAYREDMSTNKPELKKVGWQHIKLDEAGNNVINGVEFYAQKTGCSIKKETPNDKVNSQNSSFDIHHHSVTPDMYIVQQVTLLKIVNTNNYAVKVSYQESDFGPLVNILVPPSGTIEGVCGATDANLIKLVIPSPLDKPAEEKQKWKSHFKSSLAVTKIQ